MVETYKLIKNSNSYKKLANKVINENQRSKATRYLKHESISIDMSQVEDDFVVLPHYRANGKKSSIKYALAETVWYASKQSKTNLIAKFGPIWKKMEDENGLINSNYGHQVFMNQDFDMKIAELIVEKKVRFFIASDDNQSSRTDLVCNNAIDLYLDEDNNLRARVVARSIDLVYGYPYDMFAAQLFVRFVQKALRSRTIETQFTNLRFDIEDVHIYHTDIDEEKLEVFEAFDDSEFIQISANVIFEVLEELEYDKLTVADVETIRNTLAEHVYIIENSSINDYSEKVEFIMYRDSHSSILKKYVVEKMTKEKKSLDQFDRVVKFLDRNRFDRKNLVKADDKLLYVSRVRCGFGTAKYEVTLYEL